MDSPATSAPPQRTADFEQAYARVNQWRGRMVDAFSRTEQAVSEMLIVLVADQVLVPAPKLPHQVGQRFDALAKALTAVEKPLPQIRTVLSALILYRRHDALRTMLCHGVTRIAVDASGAWIAIMKLINFKAGASERTRFVVEEEEAQQLLDQLIEDRHRLATALGQLRKICDTPSPPNPAEENPYAFG
jgi:hypothetical protein